MRTITEKWDLTPEEAVARQRELATHVQTKNGFDPAQLRTVAGIDASYKDVGLASVVVLSYPELTVQAEATASGEAVFPYVPGLLSFRESPLALAALEKLPALPDLLMLDGQGIAHPRRFGIACHLGVLLDIPTIGVAKSVLVGKYEDLGEEPGEVSPLVHRGETVGMAVRTKKRTNPLIVSIGHKIDLSTAVEIVLSCVRGYRLPDTTRRAHNLAAGQSQLPPPMLEPVMDFSP